MVGHRPAASNRASLCTTQATQHSDQHGLIKPVLGTVAPHYPILIRPHLGHPATTAVTTLSLKKHLGARQHKAAAAAAAAAEAAAAMAAAAAAHLHKLLYRFLTELCFRPARPQRLRNLLHAVLPPEACVDDRQQGQQAPSWHWSAGPLRPPQHLIHNAVVRRSGTKLRQAECPVRSKGGDAGKHQARGSSNWQVLQRAALSLQNLLA
jgi:hypothetical protein